MRRTVNLDAINQKVSTTFTRYRAAAERFKQMRKTLDEALQLCEIDMAVCECVEMVADLLHKADGIHGMTPRYAKTQSDRDSCLFTMFHEVVRRQSRRERSRNGERKQKHSKH